jgi:hypothetical protein
MRTSALLICVLVFSGCFHHYPPEIAGQRINSRGEVDQKVIRVAKGVRHTALTPDGPRDYENITCKYYLVDGGKPEREFFIGDNHKAVFLNEFLAVTNSLLWVTYDQTIVWTNRPGAAHTVNQVLGGPTPFKPYISYQVNDLEIYVFDAAGFFRHRTLMALQKGEVNMLLPEEQIHAADFVFEDGNRSVVFKSPKGIKKYDLLNDTVTDAEPSVDGHK